METVRTKCSLPTIRFRLIMSKAAGDLTGGRKNISRDKI